jgi:hypothetical protein
MVVVSRPYWLSFYAKDPAKVGVDSFSRVQILRLVQVRLSGKRLRFYIAA